MIIKTDIFRPRILNIILTISVLCLPILREQYTEKSGNILVARYRPIMVIINNLRVPGKNQPYLLIVVFILVIYVIVSIILSGLQVLLKIIKSNQK
jgi:hypothetical protein